MSQPTHGAEPRPYADKLRHDIDAGRTGDKVAYPDPAAAPLGTDEEAAGFPPSARAVRQAIGEETAEGDNPARAVDSSSSTLLEGGPVYVLMGLVVVALLVVMFYSITNLR